MRPCNRKWLEYIIFETIEQKMTKIRNLSDHRTENDYMRYNWDLATEKDWNTLQLRPCSRKWLKYVTSETMQQSIIKIRYIWDHATGNDSNMLQLRPCNRKWLKYATVEIIQQKMSKIRYIWDHATKNN